MSSRPNRPRLVLVEHDDDVTVPVGVFANQFLLRGGHGAAHKGNDLATTVLMKFHRIEESLDDNKWFVRRLLDGSINVEKFERFSEALRELVFRRVFGRFARPASGVSHDVSIRVTDGNGDALRHHAF